MGECIWRDTYSLGNEQIDVEHQHLIELANDVAAFAARGGKNHAAQSRPRSPRNPHLPTPTHHRA